MKKKVISLLLCTLIAGGSVSLFSVNAAENEQEAHYIRAVENNNLLTYYNENGEEVDVDKLNNDVDVNKALCRQNMICVITTGLRLLKIRAVRACAGTLPPLRQWSQTF